MKKRNRSSKLNILPKTPRVPKPQVKPVIGAPFSQRGARARIDSSPSGVKGI